jgi:16S rRNA (adenine1518-N6/adenine1519-N6)-dimethyltransferase
VVRALEAERLLPDTVRLLHRDALDLDLGALMRDDGVVRIVANLPYSVATPLLRRFLDHAAGLSGWSVLVQREMGERLTARTGTRDYGSLAVLHQLVADVRRGVALPASCFYPVPRVVSRFVHVVPREGGALDPERLAAVERVARAGFAHRRKTLVNSLRTAGATALGSSQLEALLGDLGVDVRARAESLPPGSWPLLERALAAAAAAS